MVRAGGLRSLARGRCARRIAQWRIDGRVFRISDQLPFAIASPAGSLLPPESFISRHPMDGPQHCLSEQGPRCVPHRGPAVTGLSACKRPRISSLAAGSRFSGGRSYVAASISSTSPISSTSKLTAPSEVRTTMFIGDLSPPRGGNRSRRRISMAVTIWPRRLIKPSITPGACGTGVICWKRNTSWTLRTSTPKNRSATKKVENCPLSCSQLGFHDRRITSPWTTSASTSSGTAQTTSAVTSAWPLIQAPARGRTSHGNPKARRSGLRLPGPAQPSQPTPRQESSPTPAGGAWRQAEPDRATGRKIERRQHQVHRLLLQPGNRLFQVRCLEHHISRHVQTAADHGPRECRGVGDQDPLPTRMPVCYP